ncbi:uncharacterized protein [Haliotis cracherodii]|uniref:uncharacterized protein n=1 Tax=Haliotis cracherodii TaxID=6455 RepID=UPI0039E7D6A0
MLRRDHVLFLTAVFVVTGLLVFTTWEPEQFMAILDTGYSNFTYHFSLHPKGSQAECKNVLDEMVRGTWTPRRVTFEEREKVERFLIASRGKYFVPTTLARPDGVCGNTTFDFLKGLQHQALWFRPLCDPFGPTPCCYNNKCVYKTVKECMCENCFDMRRPINAELADWKPSSPNCQISMLNKDESCELIKGATIYYIGDSFLRQMYTVTVHLLTGNYKDSTLKSTTPTGWREYCSGWMQLLCYSYLNYVSPVCGGQTNVIHVELITHDQGPRLLSLLKSKKNQKSIFFVGIGIHGTYNEQLVWKNFLSPSINFLHENARNKTVWPKLVWVSPHAPGILKTPRVPGQSYSSVVRYNAFINSHVRAAGIPILDTFNMTDGIMSYDGAHYGFGINMIKSQIVFNYLTHLRAHGIW